jgi:YfiH family protein
MVSMFRILGNNIFNSNLIISGVTQKNQELFPPHGFSISHGDILSDEEVQNHRKYLADHLKVDFNLMKFQKQIHGDRIRIIDENSVQEDSDGMMTNIKGIVLSVTIADCCGILIHDPNKEAIAAVHSGWRGTQQNIAAKGIKMMNSEFDSDPKDLRVYLSPCASGDKYEVGKDVARFFPNSIKPTSDEKYLFDNKKEIVSQLLVAGISRENIEVSDICTISDSKISFIPPR